jgi:small conductance mechanosensitive channel
MNIVEELLSPSHVIGAVLLLIIALLVASVLSRLFSGVMRRIETSGGDLRVDRMSLMFTAQLGRAFIWLVVLMIYAHVIPSLDRLGTALLAGVSIVSIVIGMAAQTTLGNLIAGISLLLYRPFSIGDRLQVSTPAGVDVGTVESLSLGYTVLRTYDNRRIVMANSLIATQVMINLTSVDARVMATIPISIGYSADIDRARGIAMELARQHAASVDVVGCPVTNLGTSSVDLSLRVWCADSGAAYQLKTDLLEQIKKRFDAEGIEIPFAYTNVVLKGSDSGPAGQAAR